MNLKLDDGFQFGLGLFETICLKDKKPILLDWHLERINISLKTFGINQEITNGEVYEWLNANCAEIQKLHALKIIVTEKNKVMALRNNPYSSDVLSKGFRLGYSEIYRNETSPFTYHKTLNYGDNILEKRKTKKLGIDELIFLNSHGQICEGSTTNIFFVKNQKIYTPKKSCGLLPGVLRRYILENYECVETEIYPADICNMDECFVTNSLMGIMRVTDLTDKHFEKETFVRNVQNNYEYLLNRDIVKPM